MTMFALLSLAFSVWVAWTLYFSVTAERPNGFRDYALTVWIGAGSLAGIVTAIVFLLKAWGL